MIEAEDGFGSTKFIIINKHIYYIGIKREKSNLWDKKKLRGGGGIFCFSPMVKWFKLTFSHNIVVRCESCIVQRLKAHNTNVSYAMMSILFLSKRGP